MNLIGWQMEEIDGIYAFIKSFPIFGSIIKIQRPNKIPDLNKLQLLKKKYHARSITIEPDISCQQSVINYQQATNPYLPTKTIWVDLAQTEKDIFNSFSKSKRRDIKLAQKKGVQIIPSNNINAFIKLKNKTAGLLGFMTTQTVKPLWKAFTPNNASLLLALPKILSKHAPSLSQLDSESGRDSGSTSGITKPYAGILLLFWQHTAYYWLAASTKEGNTNLAPTLLVWEAIKLAKQKKCKIFDFEGIYDERFHNLNKNWLGFTRFKQGFGGKEIYFPKSLKIQSIISS